MLKFKPNFFGNDKFALDTGVIFPRYSSEFKSYYRVESMNSEDYRIQTYKIYSKIIENLKEEDGFHMDGPFFNWSVFSSFEMMSFLVKEFLQDGMYFDLWDQALLDFFDLKETLNGLEPRYHHPINGPVFEQDDQLDYEQIEYEDDRHLKVHDIIERVYDEIESLKIGEKSEGWYLIRSTSWFILEDLEVLVNFELNYSLRVNENFNYFLLFLLEVDKNIKNFLDFNYERFLKEGDKDDFPTTYANYFDDISSKKDLFLNDLEAKLLKYKNDHGFNPDIFESVKDWIKINRERKVKTISVPETKGDNAALHKKKPETLKDIWNRSDEVLQQVIDYLKGEPNGLGGEPLICEDEDNNWHWNESVTNHVQYLLGFYNTCMDCKLIMPNKCKPANLKRITENTFNISPDKNNFSNVKEGPSSSEYLKPFEPLKNY